MLYYIDDVLICGTNEDYVPPAKLAANCAMIYNDIDDGSTYFDTDTLVEIKDRFQEGPEPRFIMQVHDNVLWRNDGSHVSWETKTNVDVWCGILDAFVYLHKRIRIYYKTMKPILEIRPGGSIYLPMDCSRGYYDKTIWIKCTNPNLAILDKQSDPVVLNFFKETYLDIAEEKTPETRETKRKIRPVNAFYDVKIDFFDSHSILMYKTCGDVILCGPSYNLKGAYGRAASDSECVIMYAVKRNWGYDNIALGNNIVVAHHDNGHYTYSNVIKVTRTTIFPIHTNEDTLGDLNVKIWKTLISMFKYIHKPIRVFNKSMTPILEIRANGVIYLAVNRSTHNIDKTIWSKCTSSTVPILDKSFDRAVLCFFNDTYDAMSSGQMCYETREMKKKIKPVNVFCDIKIDFF
jgi:hypothetical protein